MVRETGASTFVFVGTFTRLPPHPRGKAEGIHVLRLDPATGALTYVETVAGVSNPSFLTVEPSKSYLYAVNADPETDGAPGGAVSAFAIDRQSGHLTFLNRQLTQGSGPCHVAVDRSGRWVLATNYFSGSVIVFPIEAGGRLGSASDFHQHEGSSIEPSRQAGPHAHSINLDSAERFGLVCDLGLDRVLVYQFDPERGKLVPNSPAYVSATLGAGPRHLAFHPNGHLVFVINELGSSLTSYAYEREAGMLREVQTVTTLPDDFRGSSACADVHVAPSGKFVYGSNRGHDSIAIFAVDSVTGRLTALGHQSTMGRTPRNFTLDASGSFLFAANENSDSIVTFAVNRETGELRPTGQSVQVPSPVCLKIVSPD